MKKFICIIIFYSIGFVHAQQKMEDSLLLQIEKADPDTTKGKLLISLSRQLWHSGNYEKAKKYALEAVQLCTKLKYKKGMANAYSSLGVTEDFLGNYPDALKDHFKALELREAIGDKLGTAASYNNIGIIHKSQGNLNEALKNYMAALKIDSATGNLSYVANMLNNIGNIHLFNKDFEKALNNYSSAMKIWIMNEDSSSAANTINNIGLVYETQGKYPLAIEKYSEAFKIYQHINDKGGLAAACINIGNLYTKLKKYKEAEEALFESLKISKEIGEKYYIKESYISLSELYDAQKKLEPAYQNFKLASKYNDSLMNEENTRKTVQVRLQYSFDKKVMGDSIANAQNLIREQFKHEEQIKQQRMYTYGGITGFVLMIIVAAVSFRAYKQKQKDHQIITEQKKLVEEKQKEILDSIRYARRIQSALITPEKYIDKSLNKLND